MQFVAHANCQQLLASLWYEGLLGFRRRHIIFKVLLTVSVSLLFPVLSVVYMIAPKCWVGQVMRRPFIKFICHSSSYMTFLCEYMTFLYEYMTFLCEYMTFLCEFMTFICEYMTFLCEYMTFLCEYMTFHCEYKTFFCDYMTLLYE